MFSQAALRRKELEKNVQWAHENDKTLRDLQDSLANTDRHLTAYLADNIDAQQIPQEAQVDHSRHLFISMFYRLAHFLIF